MTKTTANVVRVRRTVNTLAESEVKRGRKIHLVQIELDLREITVASEKRNQNNQFLSKFSP
jgi:hypothetical protein